MKVYVVMSGWDNHDADPHLREVFANRDDAVKLIEKEFEEDYKKEVELYSLHSDDNNEVRKKVSLDRWATEVDYDGHWMEGNMWIIKEKEVL
jgi:hypothetical protein